MTYKVTVTEDVTKVTASGNTTSINITGQQTEISVVNPAASVTFKPSQSFVATNVQDALFEAHKMAGQQVNNYSVKLDTDYKFRIEEGANYGELTALGTQFGWTTNLKSSNDLYLIAEGSAGKIYLTPNDSVVLNKTLQANWSGLFGDEFIRTNSPEGNRQHIVFAYDDTDRGYISVSGDKLYLGSQQCALGFDPQGLGGDVHPITSAGFKRDAQINLGKSDARFKDLWLSGGVYIGGTASANHLDDYEEGTWTPTLTCGNSIGLNVAAASYTKVGNLVTVTARLTNINTNDASSGFITLGGLPFQPNNIFPCIVTDSNIFTAFSGIVSGVSNAINNTIAFRQSKNTFVVVNSNLVSTTTGQMIFQCCYKTDS